MSDMKTDARGRAALAQMRASLAEREMIWNRQHLDDDEGVKMLRETATIIGLTSLLIRARTETDLAMVHECVRAALRILGDPS